MDRDVAHRRGLRPLSWQPGASQSVRADHEVFGAPDRRRDRARQWSVARRQVTALHGQDRNAGLRPVTAGRLEAQRAINTNGNGRFFSTGDAKPETARANWSRYLDTLFRLGGIVGGHSHGFRDTFAVDLLLAGASIETVAMPLDHSSIRVTERHYRSWVQSLQRKLEDEVARTWTGIASSEHPAGRPVRGADWEGL